MKIYIVLIEDHHSDVEVIPFASRKKALYYAEKYVKSNMDEDDEYEEYPLNKSMIDCNWIYHNSYGCESDYVTVIEKELHE